MAVWNLARDIQLDAPFTLALERDGSVGVGRVFGTFPEGGPFEVVSVAVAIVDGGRITRLEFFEIEDVAAARARFAELRRVDGVLP